MPYRIVKRYGHERGLSCCFRQWRAKSHCSHLHGYSLAIEVTLEAHDLDANNWVYDYGNFSEFKEWLDSVFDHTLLLAADDPYYHTFLELGAVYDVAKIVALRDVGCEAFARLVYGRALELLACDRVKVVSAKVSEHAGNSALYVSPAYSRESD